MIFVKNLKSVSDQEWTTTDKYPGVRWKFLIDGDFTGSAGLSLGLAEIAPGGDLILHYHLPAEIYVVTNGKGTLNKSGELEEIKKVGKSGDADTQFLLWLLYVNDLGISKPKAYVWIKKQLTVSSLELPLHWGFFIIMDI